MSSSLIKNPYFNKSQANKIVANDILADKINADYVKANEIKDNDPSYLFSIVLFPEHSEHVTFIKRPTGGTFKFSKSLFDVGSNSSIIQFTDRPLRQTGTITLDKFVDLFLSRFGDDNSFELVPPNVVLVHNTEQRTYTISLGNHDNSNVQFELELLGNEIHNDLETLRGQMNLFVS